MEQKNPWHFNSIDQVKKELLNHRVKLITECSDIPPDLFLIEVTVRTNILFDFIGAYGNGLFSLARRVLGDAVDWNTYGIMVDDSGRMVYAFNRRLAGYDKETQRIVYRDPEEFLIQAIQEQKESQIIPAAPQPVPPIIPFPDNDGFPGSDNIIMYAVGDPWRRDRKRVVFLYAVADPQEASGVKR